MRQYYKKGKTVEKKKSGKKFPDLTGDGKVTRADVLKGRGVFKGLYYYMNRAKKRGTSKPGKGSVTDKALKQSAKTAKK